MSLVERDDTRAATNASSVFISYSRKDLAFVDKLAGSLSNHGISPKVDRADISSFEDWWKRIQELIREADTIIFVLSPDAIFSTTCLREVNYALALNKRFAPIVCRPVAEHIEAVPKPLADLNFVYFEDEAKFEPNLAVLVQALSTDLAWIRQHTGFGLEAKRWDEARRPKGLLLRSPRLEEAEHWIASRPPSAPPAATEAARPFVLASRRAATQRRNYFTGALGAGLIIALSLAGLAFWQRDRAVEQRRYAVRQEGIAKEATARAEQEVAAEQAARKEATAQKDRADKSATDARNQRDAAERATAQANLQASRADARASLFQADAMLEDSPREALRRAYDATTQSQRLGVGREAFALFSKVLNGAREIPPPDPYGNYSLGEVNAFALQPATETPAIVASSRDLTGIINEAGIGVGRPIGSEDIDRSYTNAAAWIDRHHFALATGLFDGPSDPARSRNFNAGLKIYDAGGRFVRAVALPKQVAVTAVAVPGEEGVLLAGDADGNVLVETKDRQVHRFGTGVQAPISRIIVMGRNLIVAFGRRNEPQEKQASPLQADTSALRSGLKDAIGKDYAVIYVGTEPSHPVDCAEPVGFQLFVCQDNKVTAYGIGNGLERNFDFGQEVGPTTALAASPVSPVVATASSDGVKLWLANGHLVARIAGSNRVSDIRALAFLDGGRRLLAGTSLGLRTWDVSDIAGQIRTPQSHGKLTRWDVLARHAFPDAESHSIRDVDAGLVDRFEPKDEYDAHKAIADGYFLDLRANGLRILDAKRSVIRDVVLPERPNEDAGAKPSYLYDWSGNDIVAGSAGSPACVRYAPDGKPKRLYAVDQESGQMLADWPATVAPGVVWGALTSHRENGHAECWTWSDTDLLMFDPATRDPKRVRLYENKAHIVAFHAASKADRFAVATSDTITGPSLLLLFDLRIDPATGLRSAHQIASLQISGRVTHLASDDMGRRFAVGVQDDLGVGVDKIRILNDKLETETTLTGIPSSVEQFDLNATGDVLLADGSEASYKADLRVGHALEVAHGRLARWERSERLTALTKQSVSEKDWRRSSILLKQALGEFPDNPTLHLLLANRQFYLASNEHTKMTALAEYDRSATLDPFNPIAYYMRGKAFAMLGDPDDAAEDFSSAIGLPHILPLTEVLAKSSFNSGIYDLSRKLNFQTKRELYLRRARIRIVIHDYHGAAEDVAWIRKTGQCDVLGYVAEAEARTGLDDVKGAIESYRLADESTKSGGTFGLEEFDTVAKQNSWRLAQRVHFKLAIAKLYGRIGDKTGAAASLDDSKALITSAYAARDLTPATRADLAALALTQASMRALQMPSAVQPQK